MFDILISPTINSYSEPGEAIPDSLPSPISPIRNDTSISVSPGPVLTLNDEINLQLELKARASLSTVFKSSDNDETAIGENNHQVSGRYTLITLNRVYPNFNHFILLF